MYLVKSPRMTAKKLAAIRRNQKLSHGPITSEVRERIRAALLRHGYDAPAEEVAMRALGEEPEQFQDLLEGLWRKYDPTDALQEGLVIRLARAMWLLNRADRMQEGYAVRQAQDVSNGREDRRHAQMMRLKITAERLRLLVQSVARQHYVTTPEDLEKMKNLHQEGVLKEMGEIALALFYQLQAPGTGEDGLDPEESARKMVAQAKEIFGIGTHPPFARQENVAPYSGQPQDGQHNAQGGGAPDFSPADPNIAPDFSPAHADLKVGATEEEKDKRYPYITAAEWEARERPRQLLENILTRQVESCEAQRKAVLKESLKGPSPYERAAEIAPTHPNTPAMQKMENYNLRQVERITNLLMKLKRQEQQRQVLERDDEKPVRVLKRSAAK
jgi:hypothetical protein